MSSRTWPSAAAQSDAGSAEIASKGPNVADLGLTRAGRFDLIRSSTDRIALRARAEPHQETIAAPKLFTSLRPSSASPAGSGRGEP